MMRKALPVFVLICSVLLLRGDQSAEWLQARYGGWGGPGVDARPGPMDAIALKDYAPKPSLIVTETALPKAKFAVIDVHAHINAKTPEQVREWVRTMDETGVETTVVLSGATGAEFDKLVDLYLKPYPARFQLFCGIDTHNVQGAPEELERCYRRGARGVGEITDKGSGLGASRMHIDDPRLDAVWEKCAELKIPANIHVADHPSCWKPLDVYQERTPDYQHFNLYGKNVSSWEELIAMRDHLLAKHPRTRFIACHLGNQGHDLRSLAAELDKHPNLWLDISARDYEVGRAPRSAGRFLDRYRERVLFGTDMGREKSMYRAWWRLLESGDEFMPGRIWWRYYGLELPDPVLERLYRLNAQRVLNWTKS